MILDDQGHLRFRVSISCKTWDGRSRKSKIPADRLGFSHALKLTKRYKIFRGHFLVIGWGCAARWGRIFTTGLTIMGLHFLLNSVTRSGVPYFRDSHQILTRHVDLCCQKRFWKSAVVNLVELETDWVTWPPFTAQADRKIMHTFWRNRALINPLQRYLVGDLGCVLKKKKNE